MDIGTLSLLLLVGILLLLAIGVPLGLASGFLGAVVVYMKFGERGFYILGQRMYDLTTEYVLISVPLFIFMAALLERSGIAKDMYDGLNIWLSRTRGGIAIVTAVMAIVMAAMSGIIGGEVVLLGLIALPQMLRLKYDQNLAIGTICASGSLGTMIPPSIVLIIYGLVTETSIHALFKAAIMPGLMLGGLYILYIIVRTRLNPRLAPLPEQNEEVTLMDKLRALPKLLPPVALVVIVLGSIYGGITGITEAAGMGVVGVLLMIVLRREFSWNLFIEALQRTFRSSGTILWVTFGATALAGAYSIAGGPSYVAGLIVGADLPPMGIILMMMALFLIMGAFMDWVGIVLLAMPVFLPIVKQLGYDPVWFGILFCVNMQVSFLSPPFGPAAFYLKSVAPPYISLTDIFKSFLPFICIQLFVLALMLMFPMLTHVFL
ncbi:MAG: TRAP transporter large permease subunit [Candidatus Competibacteraceae bacterium]|nr:TRAP transporter large permease subunit [Candidatus Competibacteraceae bacterium]